MQQQEIYSIVAATIINNWQTDFSTALKKTKDCDLIHDKHFIKKFI
jgi:hypothetical protein